MRPYRCAFIQRTIMTQPTMCFSVDTVKLSKYKNNFLKSSVGIDAIQAGELSGDERLFMALLDSNLLNSNIIAAQQKIIRAGEEFDEAFIITNGEVLLSRGEKSFRVGPGAVIGLAEGMVGLPSRYSIASLTALQVKVIQFHKVDTLVHQLPAELKSILVTIIKRNLAPT
jgi:CRP-like cAMP-binding protein